MKGSRKIAASLTEYLSDINKNMANVISYVFIFLTLVRTCQN